MPVDRAMGRGSSYSEIDWVAFPFFQENFRLALHYIGLENTVGQREQV